jgi:hypothetical protein
MPDYTVRVIQDQHVPYFGVDNKMHDSTRVGIMVGGVGPFYQTFLPPSDTAVDINNWKQKMVDRVRAVQGA